MSIGGPHEVLPSHGRQRRYCSRPGCSEAGLGGLRTAAGASGSFGSAAVSSTFD